MGVSLRSIFFKLNTPPKHLFPGFGAEKEDKTFGVPLVYTPRRLLHRSRLLRTSHHPFLQAGALLQRMGRKMLLWPADDGNRSPPAAHRGVCVILCVCAELVSLLAAGGEREELHVPAPLGKGGGVPLCSVHGEGERGGLHAPPSRLAKGGVSFFESEEKGGRRGRGLHASSPPPTPLRTGESPFFRVREGRGREGSCALPPPLGKGEPHFFAESGRRGGGIALPFSPPTLGKGGFPFFQSPGGGRESYTSFALLGKGFPPPFFSRFAESERGVCTHAPSLGKGGEWVSLFCSVRGGRERERRRRGDYTPPFPPLGKGGSPFFKV